MYTGIKPIIPTYLVQITNDCVYYVEASRCTVDGTFGTFNVNTLPCYTIGSITGASFMECECGGRNG